MTYAYLWSRPEQRQWSPLNLASLRSSWDLRDDLELDAWLLYTGKLGAVPTVSPLGVVSVDPSLNLTLRLGWRPQPGWELSLVGANLLDSQHLEAVQEVFTYPVEVERSLYGQVKWSF
jgi:iron complex outermembrane receptor protein